MSYKTLPTHFPKDGQCTSVEFTEGAKPIKEEKYRPPGMAADIFKAPPSRVYTQDYSKTRPSPNDRDETGPAIGNPLIW